jgi:prolipoprotein diacylglyceryltransferase
MINELFVLGSAICFAALLFLGFRYLPREKWQILAAVPFKKDETGSWYGVNLTYYGFLIASAQIIALSMLFVLMGALNVSRTDLAIISIGLLSVCFSASKILAKIVEKKLNTFTVGGASFVGIILAPLIVWMFNGFFHKSFPMVPFLAAASIAYALGEGMGRLACISFGCCYGKPLSGMHPSVARFLKNVCISFEGKTKKIAYEAGMEGTKVLPVQPITSILYVSTGLAGVYLYLNEKYAVAFVLTIIVTQGWRFFSEILRADYRGKGKITAYQCMSLFAVLLAIIFLVFTPYTPQYHPDLLIGIKQLWDPVWIIFVQLVWVTVFLYLGRSRVTSSTLVFNVRHDMI